MSLRFNANAHRYWLDGKPVQGVTTILRQGLPAPFLIDWAARTVAEYAADHRDALWSLDRDGMVAAAKIAHKTQRDTAGTRGKSVHAWAEQVIHGGDVDVPVEIAGYVEAAVRFMDDWRVEPLAVERPCASRLHWYAGTWDLVARSADPRVSIFDYKSAKSVYGKDALQVNAYAHTEFYTVDDAELPTAALGIEAAYAVHLRADGYDVQPLEFGPHVFADFLAVQACAHVAKRVETYVLDPVEPPAEEEVA